MSMHSVLATAAVATLALSGCIYTAPGPGLGPGGPTIIIGSGAPAPGNLASTGILAGAGTFDPTLDGYIITANNGVFRITWTGFREFSGSVFASTGALGRVFAGCQDGSCSLATSEDAVAVSSSDPDRVDFGSFPASGNRSGFDVEVSDNRLILDLLIEEDSTGAEVRDPSKVVFTSSITGQQASAPDDPFELLVQPLGQVGQPQPAPEKNTGMVPAPQRDGGTAAQILWAPGQPAARFGLAAK